VEREGPRGGAAHTVLPLLAGAIAAAAGVLLFGWPHRPPLPGHPGELAAAALVVMAVLLVFAPAVPVRRRASDVARDRLVAARADADRAYWSTGQLLDPVYIGAGVDREVVERPAGREVVEPAR
jgi:hypothetical protein